MSPYPDSIAYLNEVGFPKYFNISGDKYKNPSKFLGEAFYTSTPYVKFESYQTVDYNVSINNTFICENKINIQKNSFIYLPADNYKIFFNFPLNEKNHEYLSASPLNFYVEEPNENDKHIFDKLINSGEIGITLDERKKRVDELEEIFLDNTESIYYITLFSAITLRKNILDYKFDSNYVKIALDVINKYPESYIAQHAVSTAFIIYNKISKEKNDNDIVNKFVEYIKTTYPNTKLIKTLSKQIELHK